MYWFFGQFPELAYLDLEDRRRILRQVPKSTYPVIFLRAFIGAVIAALFVRIPVAMVSVEVSLVAVLATIVGGTVYLYHFQMKRLRIAMRRAIALGFRGERLPFCLGCGYDLRGGTSDACPECGMMAIVPATLR